MPTCDGHEAADDRTAALGEVLKAISASTDDPQLVFELIARHARALCGAATVAVTERVMEGAEPTAKATWSASYPRRPGPEALQDRVVLACEIVHIRDLDSDLEIFRQGRQTVSKSFIGVPLTLDGRVIGAFELSRSKTGGFDYAQVALLESFANPGVARHRQRHNIA